MNFSMQNKYLKIFIIICGIIVLGLLFRTESGGAKNIQIDGNHIIMDLGKKHISATLAPKSQESFLVDSGDASLNFGDFYVVPIQRAKELERSYPEFQDCGSFDNIEGYKDSLIYVGFIATNKTAEIELKEAAKLLHKGVAKITGSKLNIPGQKEIPDTGFMNLIGKGPGIYYLIDKIEVIDIQYQKGINYY